jgi:hypothetical protein
MTDLYAQIVEMLEPIIGKNMAIASVKTQCNKMGVSPEQLSKEHIDGLVKYLQPAVKVFAGQAHTDRVIEKIMQLKSK